MQTGQFGNMLLLDDDPNLADSDKSYTEVRKRSDKNTLKWALCQYLHTAYNLLPIKT